MGKVAINPPKTPVTKGSSGIAAATLPNVCKMPGPPAPFVPTPLPNIGKSGDSPKGYSTTVTIEGQPVAITGASFGSQGDIASKGTGGGLISSNTHGPTKFIGPGSMNVQIEGKNVQLLSDPMLNNCGPSGSPANAATMTGLIQGSTLVKVIYGDDKPCTRKLEDGSLCNQTHPLEAGPETLDAIGTLFDALKNSFEAQKEKIRDLNQATAELDDKDRKQTDLETRRKKRGLPADLKAKLDALPGEIEVLKAKIKKLRSDFKTDALLRWDRTNLTYSKGYMVGVMVCVCKIRKLAACSGKAPPAFARSVPSGFVCASPPVVGTDDEKDDDWQCAAKQIMEKNQEHSPKHKPKQLIERWFSPMVEGLKPSKGPKIVFKALVENEETKELTVEPREMRPKTGEDVPSCEKCQNGLPALYCDTKCP